MVLVFLANGFEEIEALATVDILRRAELDVTTVGIGGRLIRGAHGIAVVADVEESAFSMAGVDAIVLPGGLPGTLNLEKSDVVQSVIDYAVEHDLVIGAICAAPSILGHKGLLEGKRAICFPGYEQELTGASIANEVAVADGNFVTGKGAGSAVAFALKLVELLTTAQDAKRLEASLQCR